MGERKWQDLAALATSLPSELAEPWLEATDCIAFALTQLHRTLEAASLLERAYQVSATPRRASALAYCHYDALLQHKARTSRLSDPDAHRKAFERWITEALRLRPDSIKDRYRLGVYFGSVCTRKDAAALRAFTEALRLFERSSADGTPDPRHFKTYVLALYGAARSAYRLGNHALARRYVFRCIRLDRKSNFQRPVFKFFLAGKILIALGQLEDAERALRLALDAPHDGERDFVYALLAESCLMRNAPGEGARWIELHIQPHKRKPYIWRLLGDIEEKRGNFKRALGHYRSSLMKDRMGRHLTLTRIAGIHEATGRWKEAVQAYEEANTFCRRKFLKEYAPALRAIARIHEERGDRTKAEETYKRMLQLPLLAKEAKAALERLAG